MKFVTWRDVRNSPAAFRDTVQNEDVVLTVGGKPFAIVVGIQEDEIEDAIDLLRRLRALGAMARMQRRAEDHGLDQMSMEDIDEEVREARKDRRRSA